ncbi:MAG TPA: ribonuclease III [Paraburkholderia sp.]
MLPEKLQARLGHAFHRPQLLSQALTHRSFGAEHNERLEFIGDAVLNCVVAAALFDRFPQMSEGDLSRARASFVNRDALARVARELDLGAAIRFGEGEQRSGGADRASIIADALEALLGAIFLDGGYDAARGAVQNLFGDALAAFDPAASAKDPKTRLQEWLQARRMPLPLYTVTAVEGEAHVQSFSVQCSVPTLGVDATGTGTSRRAAEQAAAAEVYARLTAARSLRG